MTAPTSKQRTTHQRSEVGDGSQIPTIGSEPEQLTRTGYPRGGSRGRAGRKFNRLAEGTDTAAQISSAPEIGLDFPEQLKPEQGRFPGPAFADCEAPRRHRREPVRPAPATPDALLGVFATRLNHAYAPKTARQYRWGLGDILKLAAERRGRPTSVPELFVDRDLLGSVLTSTARAGGGPEVAGWTVPARRNAAYAAASLLAPELRACGIAEPRQAVDEALQLRAERVGNTYRLPKPLPRNYGRGPAPSAVEVRALVQAAGSDPGWRGTRDSALFQTMIFTAARVNAIRELDGSAIHREPDGDGRMIVHAKYWRDSGEFVIPAAVMTLIEAYAADFNLWAAARGLPARVGVGVPGPLWRSRRGTPVSYDEISHRLTQICAQAGIARYTPHAFRYAFATLGTEVSPRSVVATAGGWTGGPRLMDEHYVHRDIDVAAAKVAAMRPDRSPDNSDASSTQELVGVG